MSASLKQKSIHGVLWTFSGRGLIHVIQFIVSMVLARLLSPEDYGVVGLAYVVIAIVGAFTNLGLWGAIVQKKEVDELDYCTMFWCDCFVRCFAFVVIFISAPYVAVFYKKAELCHVVRYLSMTMLIGIMSVVPGIKLTRAFDFKTQARISLTSAIISSVLVLVLSIRGFGVWALIWQNIVDTFIGVALTLKVIPWIPKLEFSWKRFKTLFGYGSRMMFAGIFSTIYDNLTSLIIGRAFSVQTLGYYGKGKHFPALVMNAINDPIVKVSFPMLSRLQDEREKCRSALCKSIRMATFVIAPTLIGIIVIAKPLVTIIYGDKWLQAIPFLRIMAFVYVFFPIHSLNLSALQALGRSDYYLYAELQKRILGIVVMICTLHFGLFVFVSASIPMSLVSIFINGHPLKKLIGYSPMMQIKDISSILFGCLFMFVVLYACSLFPFNQFIIMALQIPIGIFVYMAYSWYANRDLIFEFHNGLMHFFGHSYSGNEEDNHL